MTLREAIKAQHDAAEAHPLTALIMSGEMSPAMYYEFLCNQLAIYKSVEAKAHEYGLLAELPGIDRVQAINEDLEELRREHNLFEFEFYDSARLHANRIHLLDKSGVLAHMYVQHMGDMYGGQLLKTKLPGSCKRYDFVDRGQIVSNLRAMLTDDLADEACQAFNFTLDLFDDIANKHNLWDSGQSQKQPA